MSREEWARSDQGKKAENGRCGLEIEAERSDDGLRSDMPNRGRSGASDRTVGTRRAAGTPHRTAAASRRRMKDPPAHRARSRAADHHETPDSRSARRPAIAAGRESGQRNADVSDSHANRRCPISSVRLGREGGRTAPLRSPAQHDETRNEGPAARRGLRLFPDKENDHVQGGAPCLPCNRRSGTASCRLSHHARVGLKAVKIGDRALRVRRRREDEALVVG